MNKQEEKMRKKKMRSKKLKKRKQLIIIEELKNGEQRTIDK